MPQVTFSPAALRDLQRLQGFLRSKSPDAARRAGEAIRQGVRVLGKQPKMGRLLEGFSGQCREWIVDFGSSGYVVLYRVGDDEVIILAIRHQKECGYPVPEEDS